MTKFSLFNQKRKNSFLWFKGTSKTQHPKQCRAKNSHVQSKSFQKIHEKSLKFKSKFEIWR